MLAHENELAAPILEFLHHHGDVRLLGKPHVRDNDRAPTIAFKPLRQSSRELARRLQDSGIGTEHGNFYAHRLISDLGIDPEDGVVRLSLVHYGNHSEVERILTALDAALNQAIIDQMKHGKTTLIEAMINQELGEPFRRDAMKKPVVVAGIDPADMAD